ncbi:YxcD family protein [Sporolactobacillus spathodeae]|uniref:DUF2653 family protein n=1 Tax=Sporolactobacillus spathodeae TaxID=1465502 RepID=A0ABS2Q9A3_9BACL|nr:YxcD family protein [Sporolactobacillus spathodeae]MBM7657905.1 hypothetical protein [Sporolactobacillus spathodeae]
MEEIILSEQEIINAVCLHIATKKELRPEDIQVELLYDDEYGYSAEVYARGRKQVLVEANLIEAIRFWLDQEMQVDPFAVALRLALDPEQGIIVHCQI